MKNVTLSLDEKTIARARRLAAEQDVSLSKFVGDLLESSMRESQEYELAMQSYLAMKPVRLKKKGAKYPSREEVHDRPGLR